ncbi:MAG: acetolactate synthase [Deltaproteobacteria bacterium RBG_13_49_15]|nr:MAG: acetolactate synthase [Deltaproteobacteria bacterium RBG_13_49_15]
MNGAQVLIRMLQEYKVEVIFGVPGDTSLPLYEALYDAGRGIRHVMARDERSASVMADAYARFSYRPGVCECPSGAGAIFSMPGVAEAFDATRACIIITSDTPLTDEGRNVLTELDCKKLYEPITKKSFLLKQVNKIPETVRRAFRIATSGAPGSVHLAIPEEVMTGVFTSHKKNIYSEPECMSYPSYRLRPSRKILEKLVELLLTAERPVIVSGGGAIQSQAGHGILALARWLGCPVVTTMSGQGIILDNHPLSMGVIGDNGFHPHALRAVEEGDVLLYIGCKMGSVSTMHWTFPSFKPDRKIIQIDADPEKLSNVYHNTLNVAGDAALVLDEVFELIKNRGQARTSEAWVESINRDRARFWKESEVLLSSEAVPIRGARVVSSINRRLDSETVVIADAGTPTPYVTRFLILREMGSEIHIPRSYGGLGYTIPALVGAYFARPKARLIGLFGDGSLGMSAGDLETLVRYRIPAILIHFNNGSFGWIKALQLFRSKGKYLSVDFTPGDPASVAEGFGLKVLRIRAPEELEKALDLSFENNGPIFLDVQTEPPFKDIPPVYSWLNASQKIRNDKAT